MVVKFQDFNAKSNLKQSLVENFPILLPVLSQNDLTEVWIVDKTVHVDLVGHIDHLLFPGIEAESLHGIKRVLRE